VVVTAINRLVVLPAALASTGAALAAPPRYLAREVPLLQHACNPAVPGSIAPVRATALADDGRIACEANCGSTIGGSKPFVALPDGTVIEYPRGSFTFAKPVGFLPDARMLLMGDTCPPLNGPCVTAIAVAAPTDAAPTTLASSPAASPYLVESQDNGWAVGWGPVVPSNAWRLRPDGTPNGTLEGLVVPKGTTATPTGISPGGVVSGSAWIGGTQRALRWDASGVGTVLDHLAGAASSHAEAIGLDGSAYGASGGRAGWWPASSSTPIALVPAGSPSVALAAAGHPASASPNGFAIFGTHINGTRLFRATGSLQWMDVGPIDASAQFLAWSIVDAPRPDFLVATALTPLYESVGFVWHQGDALRRLEEVVVNLPVGGAGQLAQLVAANAMGTILVNAGPNLAPYALTRLTDGDVDGDGVVGALDLANLLDAWGPVEPTHRAAADFDGNQSVDGGDVAVLLANWSG